MANLVQAQTGMAGGVATSLGMKKRDIAKVIGELAGLGAKEVKTLSIRCQPRKLVRGGSATGYSVTCYSAIGCAVT